MALDPIPCAHCGVMFTPSRRGHQYHSVQCRHAGPMGFGKQKSEAERASIERLFDETRDPEGPTLPTDWYPGIGTPDGDAFGRLEDLTRPLSVRRAWFLRLRQLGRV